MSEAPASASDFERALRQIGAERYHHLHPFNVSMHAGELDRAALCTWVRNRYYYQTRIPIKDGMILAKSPDRGFRREWIQRIHDHDGSPQTEGGLELWLCLTDAVGLDRGEVESFRGVLPGVRRACDAYVEFVASHDLLESVAASLTELFAGGIMETRIAAFEKHYPWVNVAGLAYFRSRTSQAPRDAAYGLSFVLENATTLVDQRRCLEALEKKCEILWSLLDAVERAGERFRLASHAALRIDPSDGAPTVVLPERAVRLAGSGRAILELCDGTRSGEDLARELAAAHPDEAGVEDDVHEFLESMEALGILARSSRENASG